MNIMTKRICCLLASVFLTASIRLTAQNENHKHYQAPPDSVVKLENTVTVHKNIRYGAIPDSIDDQSCDRILDLYLPEQSELTGLLPVLVFVHGGGFANGDKWAYNDICSKISRHRFAVVSINYRLKLRGLKERGVNASGNTSKGLPENGVWHPLFHQAVMEASDDAILALAWVKKNAAKYKFNLQLVSISGGSAGGMTALYTTYASGQKVVPIHRVVDFWGGLENAQVIKKNTPPVLIYHGDQDQSVHVDYAYAIKKRMDEIHSTRSELHILEGKGHAQYKLIAAEKIEEIVQFLK